MNILQNRATRAAFAAVVAILVCACQQAPRFTIEGKVENAAGRTLYLLNIGTNSTARIDSAKLGESGEFSFSHKSPDCYDFYALQLQNSPRRITVAIDSTETVTVTTTAAHFADSCTIAGSQQSIRIRELAMLEKSLQQQVNALLQSTSMSTAEKRETIYNLIGEFKRNIFTQYIATAPHRASAYYALFLRLNGEPLFSPTKNRFDSQCFATVATMLNNNYPQATRAIHLYNIASKGIASTRPAAPKDTIDINSDRVEKIGLYNIELPDINGDTVSLRSLKGKVVLLDFTVYSVAGISSRNIGLRDIYTKYHDRGFEVYQVSFDENENFWSNSAENLPWVCVRDAAGRESKNLLLYNISSLPTYYLINRENEIVNRDNQVEDIEAEIEKLLNE